MKVVIVGAGIAGATAAVLFRDRGHEVEVFETRDHIGGNCYDQWVDGIMVHQYGPHGFHTSNADVWNFLNRFTSFRETGFEVVANTPLGVIPVPFNDLSAEIVGDLTGEQIRDLIFVAYSEKHWGIPWSEIPRSITSRVPQRRESRDCRYSIDRWQGIPTQGYTKMFEAMFNGVKVHLSCEADAWRRQKFDHLVYTGSVDTYFGDRLGVLEYRSLDFEYKKAPKRQEFQINECNRSNPWTRSVDHSHWFDQNVAETLIAYEFPCEWTPDKTRFYPKPFGKNPDLYAKYREMARLEKNVSFVGRLATYKYLDMDDAVAQVLTKIRP